MTDRICSVEGCGKPHAARGWCKTHYYALRPGRCARDGCQGRRNTLGFCEAHARGLVRVPRSKAPCVCPECGDEFFGKTRSRFCSVWCKAQANRNPLRKAVEADDRDGIIAAAKASSVVTSTGCWEWQYALNSAGYGFIGQGGKSGLVHRHVAHAALGITMTRQPVHHKCANRKCCNPDHLQITTARENVAEMLGRNYYVRRIMTLETALAEVAPDHSVLLEGAALSTFSAT